LFRLAIIAFVGFYGYNCLTGGCGNIYPDKETVSSYQDNLSGEKADHILKKIDATARKVVKDVKEGLR